MFTILQSRVTGIANHILPLGDWFILIPLRSTLLGSVPFKSHARDSVTCYVHRSVRRLTAPSHSAFFAFVGGFQMCLPGTHLYKRACLLVCPFIRLSIRPSVHMSVMLSYKWQLLALISHDDVTYQTTLFELL